MLSLCNNWEFIPEWFDGFATGEGEGAAVRLPHTVQEIPQHFTDHNAYQKVCGYRRKLELGEELKSLTKPIYLVGDGATLTYKTLGAEIPDLILPPEHRLHQRATGVALLAEKMAEKGEAGDGNALTPNYLRLSQAERERLEKQKK